MHVQYSAQEVKPYSVTIIHSLLIKMNEACLCDMHHMNRLFLVLYFVVLFDVYL